ncbi:MAG: amylo-alpha-1,6-glucosidase [Proteobacteria bacterium]|nr:amylo-alpha-1,6-glucosidase [Pseudomonadota bacterium]
MTASDTPERRGLLPRFTLKDSDTFLLADALGDVRDADDGMFTNDTRVLSRYELRIAGDSPSLLGAAICQDNSVFTAHLTNRPLPALNERSVPQGVIHLERTRCLSGGRLYERLQLTNFSEAAAVVPLELRFQADFRDIFEVKGHSRPARGTDLPARQQEHAVQLAYRGLDGVLRVTCIEFSPAPRALDTHSAQFEVELGRGEVAHLYVKIGVADGIPLERERFDAIMRELHERETSSAAVITTSGRLFDQWIERSRSDLALLTTQLATGPYPYAGIPWFATQFGRDAIITGLQTLWLDPELSAGVLSFLASTQAQEESAFRDSQPGKILHEARRGEMAALGEVPFGRYYGGVDTTPLFVMLAAEYERHTGSRRVVDGIWHQIMAATAWIERQLDEGRHGLLYYQRARESGLKNQAWKDSQDSIFHADGSLPNGAVAVVEVQGYAYAALNGVADLASVRGEFSMAQRWRERAETLRATIERLYWMPDMGFYAIALDDDGEQCKIRASNAGHLLYCAVPEPDRGASVCAQLLAADTSSGWGIRTLAEGQVRYNPMSYHNGSVWPHDTAICAAGIARYGERAAVVRIVSEMFEVASHFSMRLPELYCGFERVAGQGPVPYPVACLPQAWACGSVFMLLQALLGLQISGRRAEVHIHRPELPVGIESITLAGLAVGEERINLEFQRIGGGIVVIPTQHTNTKVRVLAHL